MEKSIWSVQTLDHAYHSSDDSGLGAARGLLIGFAISQIFWVALALWLL